ncbi:MAG: hypothetical protein BMS9Abin06_1203 [Gammaproteobacteria bacterium]|nr:MAG: hypothetical protein BMS9Abin06_1203 [Gammaproteobacteria bacterium]
MGKQLNTINNELERAVFMARYNSHRQRLIRSTGALLIFTKHGLRGLLYVWPLTLLLFVELPGAWDVLRLVLVGLAVAAWSRFIYGSVRDDYRRFLAGELLKPAALKRVL